MFYTLTYNRIFRPGLSRLAPDAIDDEPIVSYMRAAARLGPSAPNHSAVLDDQATHIGIGRRKRPTAPR